VLTLGQCLEAWIHRCLDAVKNKQGSPNLCERVWVKKLVHESRARFRTWNKGTLTCKYMEIVDVVTKRKINFMCQQETMGRWKDERIG